MTDKAYNETHHMICDELERIGVSESWEIVSFAWPSQACPPGCNVGLASPVGCGFDPSMYFDNLELLAALKNLPTAPSGDPSALSQFLAAVEHVCGAYVTQD